MRLKWFSLSLLCVVALLFAGCRGDKIDPGMGDDLGPGGEVLDVGETLGPNDLFQGETPFGETMQPVEGVDLSPVQFGYDSFQIAPREMSKIEQVAGYLNENSNYNLVIAGHCDERGSREYNLSLGDRRAQSIRSYLISLGIDALRIQTKSFGEEQPIDPGHNEAAWRLNRRGEFDLYR